MPIETLSEIVFSQKQIHVCVLCAKTKKMYSLSLSLRFVHTIERPDETVTSTFSVCLSSHFTYTRDVCEHACRPQQLVPSIMITTSQQT